MRNTTERKSFIVAYAILLVAVFIVATLTGIAPRPNMVSGESMVIVVLKPRAVTLWPGPSM